MFKRALVLCLLLAGLSGCRRTSPSVDFETPEGRSAHALYRLPPASFERPVPAVIYNHGRLIHGNDVELSASLGYDVSAFVSQLASEGYAAIAPIRDPQAGPDENADMISGTLLFLEQQPEIDASRVGVIGFSLGGGPALQAAGSHDLNCVVLISPKLSADDLSGDRLQIDAPFLVLYGKKDLQGVIDICDRVLIPGLTALNKQFQVKNEFNVRHRWFMRIHRAYWREISRFLGRNLKLKK